MAVKIYLKLDGVTGDVATPGHVGEIELLSIGWEQLRKGAGPASTGMVAGTLSFGEIRMTAVAGKAGPELMIRCVQGTRSPNAVITLINDGVQTDAFTTIRLTDVLISSYSHSGMGDVPVDQFSFSFPSLELEYRPTISGGGLGTPIKGS